MTIHNCIIENINKYSYDEPVYSVETVSKRWHRGLTLALNASNGSDAIYPQNKMGAVIMAGSRVLSIGSNQYNKTRPGNVLRKDGKLVHISTHAEQVALDGIKYRAYSSKLICYVARINSTGNLVTSKPCILCIASLKKAGISIVRFINSNGLPEEMYL